MSRDSFRYNVAPRYTAGSPALVDRDTGLRVAQEEQRAYQRAVEGAYGEEEQQRAVALGVSGIVEERTVFAHHYLATDAITGEKRDSRKPTREQLAAVERFKQIHGRMWKVTLAEAWQTTKYQPDAGTRIPGYEPVLNQLREHCGRTWLYKVKS